MCEIKIKRAYDAAASADGFRVYVDRLWPQGLSHETFHYDLWAKSIAPPAVLRQWFHENPQERWSGFEEKYRQWLSENPDFPEFRKEVESHPVVTFLYSSRDQVRNNAVTLRKFFLDNK